LILIIEATVAVLALSVGVALAAGNASAGDTQTVTSASWGSVFVLQGQNATSGALIIDWTNVKKNPYKFIDLVTTSSVALVGQTISTSTVRNGSGNQPLPIIAFSICRGGVWDSVTGLCSGTVIDLGAGMKGTLQVTEPVPVGGTLAIRASTTAVAGSPFSTTFTSAVTRTQIRAATVVNQ
jgi:hypothetical protein